MIWSDEDLKVVAERAVQTWLSLPKPRPTKEDYIVKVACEWTLEVLIKKSLPIAPSYNWDDELSGRWIIVFIPEEQP